MMQEEGGGAAADRPLRSNINSNASSSGATPLKSLFLSRIGLWASSVVPPLGALLGVRLAETCEKAGPSVGGPHLQCQRCESVLEPGVSCSIGIDDGKQKHKAVYICNYCGFRNPKPSPQKNKNQKSASEEQQQQQSSKKKKRKWSSLKDIASTSQKELPKKKMSFEKQEQQLLIENGDSRKAEGVTMNNGGDQSMAIVIVDQEKSQQEVNSSADFKLCALRKVVNMEAGISDFTAESGAVHAAEEPVTIEPDEEDDQAAAAADLAPEARAVTIVLADEEKESVVKNAENNPVAEVAEAIQIQETDDVPPEAVVAEPELPQLRASDDREETQLPAPSELLVKEPDQLLASEQNPAELPESPLSALAKNTEMVESVPVETQLLQPEELPAASLEKEIPAEQSEAEGLPASLEAKVLAEQSEPEGLPVSMLPAEQSEPEGLSASAEQSAMAASMEAELPASEDEKMETVPEDHEKLESVPEDEISPAEMDCETMKGTSLESDAVPEETEDGRVSARKMRSVVRSFLHAKRLQVARFDSRLGAVKRQFKVMGDRCSRGRKKLRRMTKLALSEKNRADNLALQLYQASGSFKTAEAHIKELKRRVSSLPSLEKQMTKFSTGLTKLSDAIKQLTMEVRKNQAAPATGVMEEEAPVVEAAPVVLGDLATAAAAAEDDVKSVGITPAAAADDVKTVAKNHVAGSAENVAEDFPMMTPEAAAGGKEKRAGRINSLRVSETSKCIRKKPSVQVKIGSVFSSPSSSRCKIVLSKVGRRWKIHTA